MTRDISHAIRRESSFVRIARIARIVGPIEIRVIALRHDRGTFILTFLPNRATRYSPPRYPGE